MPCPVVLTFRDAIASPSPLALASAWRSLIGITRVSSRDSAMSVSRATSVGGTISRRRLLLAVTTAAASALPGCAFRPFDEGGPVPSGRLFVENRTNFPRVIALSVTDDTRDGSRVMHDEYRVPEWHALQFGDVLEPEHTYDIRAFQPDAGGGGPDRLGVTVEPCETADPADQMDVVVLASADGPDILTYDCDEAYAKTQSLTYVDPTAYRTERITGTIPSPTPS